MDDPAFAALRPWAAALATFLGAVVGSFVNVLIVRLPRGESIVRPRSHCPGCGALVAWYDNVPVLSFALLRGRCRSCRARISLRYPLVELLVAAAAWLAWRRHGLGAAFAAELALAAILVALAFIDLASWLLPHALTWPLAILGLLASALGLSPSPSIASSLLGAAAGFAAFAAVAWVGKVAFRKEAMGFGDVWLLTGIGAWMGARGLLPVVLLASLQGSVAGLLLLVLGRAMPGPHPAGPRPDDARRDEERPPAEGEERGAAGDDRPPADEEWIPPRNAVPFGPFLALGALEWLYLQDAIVRVVPLLRPFR